MIMYVVNNASSSSIVGARELHSLRCHAMLWHGYEPLGDVIGQCIHAKNTLDLDSKSAKKPSE